MAPIPQIITTLNTTFYRFTENPTGIYQINPFDINGNLFKRVNIEITTDPGIWNGEPYIIYIPNMVDLNGNLDFEVNLTNFTLPSPDVAPWILSTGNDVDNWNYDASYLSTNGSISWKPQSYDSTLGYGWWLVSSTTPYSPPAFAPSLSGTLEGRATEETKTDWKGQPIK